MKKFKAFLKELWCPIPGYEDGRKAAQESLDKGADVYLMLSFIEEAESFGRLNQFDAGYRDVCMDYLFNVQKHEPLTPSHGT